MSDDKTQALNRALYKVLKPMVRLLMRHGVSYRSFADVARHVYVDVAETDFALEGRKSSKARTAVLTGINRKDIAKLKERVHPLSDDAPEAPTPAARLITGWLNNRHYLDQERRPAVLPLESAEEGTPSFAELVRTHTNDVPVRAALDELQRIGAVSKRGDQVELIAAGYVPEENMKENLRIFGTAAADLLATMDHNIAKQVPGPFIQRTVSYDAIPTELLERIRQRSREEGQAFLLQVNEWLAEQDRDQNRELTGSGRNRAGIGLYYFEHPLDEGEEH